MLKDGTAEPKFVPVHAQAAPSGSLVNHVAVLSEATTPAADEALAP